MRRERAIGGAIPWVLALSPTMRCNYDCGGCYSRGRPTDNELSPDEIDELLTEAEELGVLSVILTGGEPLLVDGLLDTVSRHRRLLFVLITNGSLVTADVARRIAASGNTITLVSLEGFPCDTDARRREGAHDGALSALGRLRDSDVCAGFAATVMKSNIDHVGSDEFIDGMASAGCALGFLTEYIPCGPAPRPEWMLANGARDALRKRVLELRRESRIVLIQFPHDEYGEENHCTAAGWASFHISSRGDVEPCPFASISRDSIREGGLVAACRSRFLRAIRERPKLLSRERYACSLFEHRDELDALARELDGSEARGVESDDSGKPAAEPVAAGEAP